jgi:hypothetical protein
MFGKTRFSFALVWLFSFSCQGSSYRVGIPDGAAGQGGKAIGSGSAMDSSLGGTAAGPDAGTGTGGMTSTSGAGTGGQGGGGSYASPDAAGIAAGGTDGGVGSGPDAQAHDAWDANVGTTVDAPIMGGDSSMGGASAIAGRSGSGSSAREDAGVGGTTALGGRAGGADAKAGDAAGASGGIDAAGDAGSSSIANDRTTFTVPQSAVRALDMLFVVDNSPSMDAKQKALAASFPTLMTALQSLPIGLPDLHVGVISSDFGAGQGEAGGNCSVVLGNQGILWGNDLTEDPLSQSNKYATTKNISDLVGNLGCGMAEGARWIENVQSSIGLERRKNYRGNLPDVFSCLTSAVGTYGCGYEHPLQALRVALNPQPNVNAQNIGFMRRNAYLAIVIVTDEDDCSADPSAVLNDGMFGPRTLGDTASMRCAVRGHVCNGLPIPNYDPATGYTGTVPFVANFEDCDAKDDPDHHNLPLLRIRDLIDSVKQVKDRPEEQILVSGIIGWPKNGDLIGVQYRIDKDTTSMPVEQQKLWDIMPICTLPTVKAADGNIYKAYGGLRLKKFIDGFGANGRVYSLCEPDLAPVMTEIGNRIGIAVAQKLWPACIPNPLMDADLILPGIQPDCVVSDGQPCDTPGSGSCLTTGYQETALPQCMDDMGSPLDPMGPNILGVPNDTDHRPCWYLTYDKDPSTGCPNASNGQRLSVLRPAGAPDGSILSLSCRTCSVADDPRCAAP